MSDRMRGSLIQWSRIDGLGRIQDASGQTYLVTRDAYKSGAKFHKGDTVYFAPDQIGEQLVAREVSSWETEAAAVVSQKPIIEFQL